MASMPSPFLKSPPSWNTFGIPLPTFNFENCQPPLGNGGSHYVWKWMCLSLMKNHLVRCWDCLFLLDWIEVLKLSLLLKLRKLKSWFSLQKLFFLSLVFVTINLPFSIAWNTIVMSRLVLFLAAWICWILYINKLYRIPVALHLLLLLNPWLIKQV